MGLKKGNILEGNRVIELEEGKVQRWASAYLWVRARACELINKRSIKRRNTTE